MKIVIISAIYKGAEYKHQAITQYQADDFFEKPLDKEKFKNRILDLLSLSASDLRSAPRPPRPSRSRCSIRPRSRPQPLKISNPTSRIPPDIFGDIIQKIEKVPEFQINLGGEQPDLNTQPENEAPRQSDPGQTVLLKKEQEIVGSKKPDPGKTLIVTQAEERRPLPESRRHAATTDSINDSLDSLRQPAKKTSPENKCAKIEDDIARRFEDTLSGLGLQPKRAATASPSPGATQVREADKAPAAPEAKPESPPEAKPLPETPPRDQIIVKEEEKSLEE